MLAIKPYKNLKLTKTEIEELYRFLMDSSSKVHDNENLKGIFLKLSYLR